MARKAASLELAVLGLLHESPLHGYELRKRLNLLLGWGRVLSYGSLYPALKRMLRAGWITEVATDVARASRGGQRIVYQITPAGQEYFGARDDRRRSDRVGGRQLRHAVRVLLAHRHRDPAAHPRGSPYPAAGAARPGPAQPRPAGADRYVSELQRHSIESVEREVSWLTDLINAERAGRPGRRTPPHDDRASQPLPHQRHRHRRRTHQRPPQHDVTTA